MAERLFKNQWINKKDIKEKIKQLEESERYFISECGNIYKQMEKDYFRKLKLDVNKRNGYVYTRIVLPNGSSKKYRVHRLVAKYFLNNPNNLPIVMHLDNNKQNNHYSNLKWGTIQENTQQAYNDGLEINDKGYSDNQSNPVYVYNLNGELLYSFGSISIASEELGISKSTISRQCKGISKGEPRCGYLFKYQNN